MTRPTEDTLEPEAVPADERGSEAPWLSRITIDPAPTVRTPAARPPGRYRVCLTVTEPERVIRLGELRALLAAASFSLPSLAALDGLPRGLSVVYAERAEEGRAHSMAAGDGAEAAAGRTQSRLEARATGLRMDPDLGREG